MIYLDTSVVLAHLLAESRQPPESLWSRTLVSSRLLEYETWNRVHAMGLTRSLAEPVRQLLGRVAFLELSRTVLAHALEPFPIAVRTLDALHLASMLFLTERHQTFSLASYDRRLNEAAAKLGLVLWTPDPA